jgi:hypothetical protein
MSQPNPRTLGVEELILGHFSLAPQVAALATGMRKFL